MDESERGRDSGLLDFDVKRSNPSVRRLTVLTVTADAAPSFERFEVCFEDREGFRFVTGVTSWESSHVSHPSSPSSSSAVIVFRRASKLWARKRVAM